MLRLVVRGLAARPVRSAVLACGFGFGIAVMASLLGVGEVILEQARTPALQGGGDLVVTASSGELTSARWTMRHVLGAAPLAGRTGTASPRAEARLYLVADDGSTTAVDARGGIPSLERALGDPEISEIAAWRDVADDAAWTRPADADLLRALDRFHPIPDAPDWRESWAEWLYFNGSGPGGRFYLTFLVGPPSDTPGRRRAGVRLQLERDGEPRDYSTSAEVDAAAVLAGAPDLTIGDSRVRLRGTTYHLSLALEPEAETGGPPLSGELRLEAVPGRALRPLAIHGARGWVSGYVVPVLDGRLHGVLRIGDHQLAFDNATGYHDHNWGFWEGVTWQWGQVAAGDLSVVYGRVKPPAGAADPQRIPGFLAVLGADGPLGFATRVTIDETDHPRLDRPRTIRVTALAPALELELEATVLEARRTPFLLRPGGDDGGDAPHLIQMRADFLVRGRAGERSLELEAPGSAETFRGGHAPPR